MARRHRCLFVAVLIALTLSACVGAGSAEADEESFPSTTTTSTTTSTTLVTNTTAGDTGSLEIDADVDIPDGEGPFPAVVLVHGGGWVRGDPSIMRPLANHLNGNGFLTVNTRYGLSSIDEPGFPQAVDDVACAVRLAASHPDSDGTVAVVGHSAGAHIGAIVALTGDEYASDCVAPGSGVPDRFVGLAGPYDMSRVRLGTIFFGVIQSGDPARWAAGNPQVLTDENPDLDSLIMYGERDGLVDDSFAIDFFNALDSSGSTSTIELVEGARHNDMQDPDVVGDLIVTWLER